VGVTPISYFSRRRVRDNEPNLQDRAW